MFNFPLYVWFIVWLWPNDFSLVFNKILIGNIHHSTFFPLSSFVIIFFHWFIINNITILYSACNKLSPLSFSWCCTYLCYTGISLVFCQLSYAKFFFCAVKLLVKWCSSEYNQSSPIAVLLPCVSEHSFLSFSLCVLYVITLMCFLNLSTYSPF